MLIEIAGGLVAVGIVLLFVGILIARQYTLRAKLLTAFLFIVLLSLGLLSAIDNHLMSENLVRSANKMLASAARQYADRVDAFNNLNLKSIRAEADLPAIINFLRLRGAAPYSNQTILEILNALRSRHGDKVSSYAVLNVDGINMVDTNISDIGRDESKEIYFSAAAGRHGPYNSPVLFYPDYEPSLYFSCAINSLSGEMLGVLRVRYNANVLKELVDSSRGLAGRGAFALLIDENHFRLVDNRREHFGYTLSARLSDKELSRLVNEHRIPPDSKRIDLEQASFIDAVDRAGYNNPGIEVRFHGLGEEVFNAAVARLNTIPWKIIFSQPQSVLMEPVEQQTQIAVLFAGGIAALVALIVMWATHVLLGPIRRLTGVVNKISSGNLDVKAEVDAMDEIGGLAGAFNDMTHNINGLVVDLEKEVDSHRLTADSLRKLSQAIEQSPVSVMITDLDGNIEYVNPEFCRITGYSSEEVVGRNPRFLKSGQTPQSQFVNMWNCITTGQSWSGELYNKKKNGELFWENVTISPIKSSDGTTTHYLAIKEDISMRKDYEERLMYQASYDRLTDLPNRTLAFDRLQQAMANSIRDHKRLAVMYLDFDHFKDINDTLGHTAGDHFLIRMAERLKALVRDVDTVARLGGDEFMLILAGSGYGTRDDEFTVYEDRIKEKAAEILREVARPCVIEDMEFSVTCSIGIAVFPEDGDDPHILLKSADTAMYRSKRKGRNTFEVFAPEMSDKVVKRVEIETRLRRALEDNRFYLMYQSLIDTRTLSLVGAEALIRWNDEELGNVSPEVFIPFAEETGIIVDIGRWVIDTACRDIQGMSQANGEQRYIAINLSSRQFRGRDIGKQIADTLDKYSLKGGNLELEITERLLMKDVPDVISTLNEFKEMGIRLSIDDFGTGYSSLSYLKRFPFDVLKIDKAFVQDIGVDPDDAALCEAIIGMAHSLGLSVIGEGVETREQYEFLRTRGAEVLQGYYFSKPMRFDEFKHTAPVFQMAAPTQR
jgi:diguanylate cyclase (GGDEF)-like protein/PAS domain S-box-containing protein